MSQFGVLDGKNDFLCFLRIAHGNGERTAMVRQGMQAKDGAGDDTKRSEGAGNEFRKVVARNILDDFAAARGERAIRKSYRDAKDEVAQRSEAQSERAAVVGGKHPANGRLLRPQRIESKPLAVLGKRLLQSFDRATCFHGDGEIGPGVLEDVAQARCGKKQVGARGRIAPAEFAAAAARDNGKLRFIGEAKRGSKLLLGGRFKKELRLNAANGLRRKGGADVIAAEDGAEVVLKCGRDPSHVRQSC